MTTTDNKTIEVTVRFWTNGMDDEGRPLPREQWGDVHPGHAWGGGYVVVNANSRHGITSQKPVHFQRMAELPLRLEQALEAAGVTLTIGPPASRLYRTAPKDADPSWCSGMEPQGPEVLS